MPTNDSNFRYCKSYFEETAYRLMSKIMKTKTR